MVKYLKTLVLCHRSELSCSIFNQDHILSLTFTTFFRNLIINVKPLIMGSPCGLRFKMLPMNRNIRSSHQLGTFVATLCLYTVCNEGIKMPQKWLKNMNHAFVADI